jgi:hypothetical protein
MIGFCKPLMSLVSTMKKAKRNSSGLSRGWFLPKFQRMEMPNEGIDRVMHLLSSDGHVSLVISDLMFDSEGVPHVVLDWAGHSNTDDPLVLKRLHPARLEVFADGAADYLTEARSRALNHGLKSRVQFG